MTLQLNNYADEYRKIIKLVDGVMTHSPKKDGDTWRYTKVEGAMTLDFLTLQHGWRQFPQKGSGQPTSYELVPAETAWTPEEARVMKANGWRFILIAKVAAKEFGGLAEIHATEPALITAINDLYQAFMTHPDSTEGTVPVVTHEVDDFGEQTMVIQGFKPRADKVFGKPLNTLPERKQAKAAPSTPDTPPAVVPAAKAKPSYDPSLLARLEARQAAKSEAAD